MEYDCQTVSVDKSFATPDGFLEPLCNSCGSTDCTNPIKEKIVSVAGINKKLRLYVVSESLIRQVVSCKGYAGNVLS